jgi:hypothetical protein
MLRIYFVFSSYLATNGLGSGLFPESWLTVRYAELSLGIFTILDFLRDHESQGDKLGAPEYINVDTCVQYILQTNANTANLKKSMSITNYSFLH